MHHLRPHPASSARHVTAVDVEATLGRGLSALTYRVRGGPISMAERADPVRTDGLWQTTCFELFVKPDGDDGYYEFNFAPSGKWAAYRFDGYRSGMTELADAAPTTERLADGVRVSMDLGSLPPTSWQIALTAVIEEPDGTKSYWSLAHDQAKPDFHHPAGFVLRV